MEAFNCISPCTLEYKLIPFRNEVVDGAPRVGLNKKLRLEGGGGSCKDENIRTNRVFTPIECKWILRHIGDRRYGGGRR